MASVLDLELADEIAKFYADPLGYVRFAFPWREPGPLAEYDGPDQWQTEFLAELGAKVKERGFNGVDAVDAIREAVASGHGIGKSTIAGWLVSWLMSTRPHSIGTVTSNTFAQLQSKTWASIQRWMKLGITEHWFKIGGDRIYAKESPDTWYCTAQTCRENNSEAFAGQHAANSTSWYLLDEASAIPEKIWEVLEGGLTDGEPHVYAFGNPTRSQGKFHRVCFGSERNRWSHRSIDSRTSALTNKKQIQQWIDDYGEDSDFVRVRVRGLPPSASDLQFIDTARVYAAQQRPANHFPDDPLVVGVDIARGGADNNVIRFRRGLDARTIPAVVIPGEQTRDSMRLVSILANILDTEYVYGDQRLKPTMMFVDATGVGAGVYDRLKQLGRDNVQEVNFAWECPEAHRYANMRAWMWQKAKEWLLRGAIDSDPQLEIDLTGPGYTHDRKDRLLLESKENMKKRGLDSPDHGDGFSLTFAQPVAPLRDEPEAAHDVYVGQAYEHGWMG